MDMERSESSMTVVPVKFQVPSRLWGKAKRRKAKKY